MSDFKLNPDAELRGQVKFDDQGLVPAIVQHLRTGEVLMQAFMNAESLDATLKTGNATFWSRSRQKLWMKGETSGNVMSVYQILLDCDADSLVLLVEPAGPACHTGEDTCYYRTLARRPVSGHGQGHACGGCGGCG